MVQNRKSSTLGYNQKQTKKKKIFMNFYESKEGGKMR